MLLSAKGQTNRIYSLILKQLSIKQQSVYGHWPFAVPKQGVQPSATWIAWISSVFFIFPGVIPSPLAFILISGIPIRFFVARFFATFVADIPYLLLVFSGGSVTRCNSRLTTAKISTKSLSYRWPIMLTYPQSKQNIRLIYFRLFTQVPPKKMLKKHDFLWISANFFEFLLIFVNFYPF